jgi:hypothetical protein
MGRIYRIYDVTSSETTEGLILFDLKAINRNEEERCEGHRPRAPGDWGCCVMARHPRSRNHWVPFFCTLSLIV